jgi:5-methylcytosine-specific restriction endonuclease McrA
VIAWIQEVFPTYREEMKGIDWGRLYNTHKNQTFDIAALETKIKPLMEGDHITPWSQGGKTTAENCQMLCKDCNRKKAGR